MFRHKSFEFKTIITDGYNVIIIKLWSVTNITASNNINTIIIVMIITYFVGIIYIITGIIDVHRTTSPDVISIRSVVVTDGKCVVFTDIRNVISVTYTIITYLTEIRGNVCSFVTLKTVITTFLMLVIMIDDVQLYVLLNSVCICLSHLYIAIL